MQQQTYNRALITVATGEYKRFIPRFVRSANTFFPSKIYIFTDDRDELRESVGDKSNLVYIYTPHLGWPMMPLLRFELLHKNMDLFKEQYLFMIDAEAAFERHINQSVQSHRVATLHRNIMRFRDEFNYETRQESTAYVAPYQGEKYYACGFVGGIRSEFARMADIISGNIRADIRNGIRARWGDESHLNRFLVHNRPTRVLPPNYMCPQNNPYFIPYIIHRDKDFKQINKSDTEDYLTVDPQEYSNIELRRAV